MSDGLLGERGGWLWGGLPGEAVADFEQVGAGRGY